MPRRRPQNSLFLATILPHFTRGRRLRGMISVYDKWFPTLCTAALVTAVVGVPAGAGVHLTADAPQEFPTETAALVAATTALFDAVEAKASPVPAVPRITLVPRPTPASLDLDDDKASVLTENGPVKHLTGYRITWYPVDRFLGTVDFMGTWDGNRNLVCGYVMWDLSDPAAPVLDDVSATYLDVTELSRQSDADVHAALLEANCAFGAIDANYTVFEPAG
jgi:hypothetical protein